MEKATFWVALFMSGAAFLAGVFLKDFGASGEIRPSNRSSTPKILGALVS